MKKNVFEDWLREFCMLVFIQTIQAFIFAIVMSLIVLVLSADVYDETNVANATGIIAVILLASVSKIEELVQKVFGIKSGVHDSSMRGGMKSLATTMMAANLAKNVLDNGKKVAGGLVGMGAAPIAARKEANQARARLARDLRGLNGGSATAGNPPIGTGAGNGNGSGYGSGAGAGAGAGGNSNTTGGGSNAQGGTNNAGSGATANEKLQEKLNAYEDKIREIQEKRNRSVRNSAITTLSGLSETAGALGGAMVGATAGAALGEGKEIFQGALAGAGLGDSAGSLAVKPLKIASDFGGYMSEVNQAHDDVIREVSNMNAQARDAIRNRDKRTSQYRAARRELDRQLNELNAGNID